MAEERVVASLSEVQIKALQQIVRTTSRRTSDGCLLVDVNSSTKLSVNQKGYVQLKVPVDAHHTQEVFQTASACKNKKVQLHQLIAWTRDDGMKTAIQASGLEISHLCHRKSCAEPSHLCAEASYMNKSRNFCKVVLKVADHYCLLCSHSPPCIATDAVKKAAQALEDCLVII